MRLKLYYLIRYAKSTTFSIASDSCHSGLKVVGILAFSRVVAPGLW
jgi:hypothetical protein